MKQVKLQIIGKVQGVNFRSTAQTHAIALNLTGYAKNLPDGSVESVVQGLEPKIKQYIDWCHKGSIDAEVERVFLKWEDPDDDLIEFKCL